MVEINFTVFGIPRTKKSHNVLARAGNRHVVLPSKAWVRWMRTAQIDIPLSNEDFAFCRDNRVPPGLEPEVARQVPDQPYNICALFYREANRGDAVGYYQGLADLLEKRGTISNDRWLVSWDGSRLLKDKENPRVEVCLTAVD